MFIKKKEICFLFLQQKLMFIICLAIIYFENDTTFDEILLNCKLAKFAAKLQPAVSILLTYIQHSNLLVNTVSSTPEKGFIAVMKCFAY